MLLLTLLLSASTSLLSQSDTVCYTSDQNRKIAVKLLEGKKCENNLTQMRLSYADCMDQLPLQAGMINKAESEKEELKKSIIEKDLQIEKLESKLRNRNKTILVLSIAEIVTVLMGVL
jgi:predicted RNase H-like nuclease (RuvC/YqgF family)